MNQWWDGKICSVLEHGKTTTNDRTEFDYDKNIYDLYGIETVINPYIPKDEIHLISGKNRVIMK